MTTPSVSWDFTVLHNDPAVDHTEMEEAEFELGPMPQQAWRATNELPHIFTTYREWLSVRMVLLDTCWAESPGCWPETEILFTLNIQYVYSNKYSILYRNYSA